MNRRSLLSLAGAMLGVLCAIAFSAIALADDGGQPSFTEEFHHSYPLAAGGSFALKNISGRIKVVGWDKNQVQVDAVKRAWTEKKLQEVTIEVDATADRVAVATRYPDDDLTWHNSDCENPDSRCRQNPASVTYTISVPRTARLDKISNINGPIDITGVAGEVRASDVNGQVTATGLRGPADLSTVNGRLEATFEAVPKEALNLRSVNGTVAVTLPSDASLEVRAHTLNGSIRNDWNVPVRHGRFVGHDLQARFANGGSELKLHNVNGGISIRHANDGKPLSPATNLLVDKTAMF
ncbi:MAG TPA: hypothetical protein VFA60_07680 [Terriglobales bacterium]|nr:hypothetical protein [Terriglobales bacterium]